MSAILSRFRDPKIVSVWALYLQAVITLTVFFCNFSMRWLSCPHANLVKLKFDCFILQYRVFVMCWGKGCFISFNTPKLRDTLFAIISVWDFQFTFSLISNPRNLNSHTLSIGLPLTHISWSKLLKSLFTAWKSMDLVLSIFNDNWLTAYQSLTLDSSKFMFGFSFPDILIEHNPVVSSA